MKSVKSYIAKRVRAALTRREADTFGWDLLESKFRKDPTPENFRPLVVLSRRGVRDLTPVLRDVIGIVEVREGQQSWYQGGEGDFWETLSGGMSELRKVSLTQAATFARGMHRVSPLRFEEPEEAWEPYSFGEGFRYNQSYVEITNWNEDPVKVADLLEVLVGGAEGIFDI